VSNPRAIQISQEDRTTLEGWAKSRTINNAMATRARIVLMTGDRLTADEIAEALGVSARNVYKWVWRYDEEGIDGLHERKRPGRPRALDLDAVLEILRATIEDLPRGATHWSLRTMAKAAGVTKHQVGEVWAAAGLKPHRVKSFKISNDPSSPRRWLMWSAST
jgi:transposase